MGPDTKTQRRGTGGLPERYQTAVCEVSPNVRVVPSYQAADTVAHRASLFFSGLDSACSRRPTVLTGLTGWGQLIKGGWAMRVTG